MPCLMNMVEIFNLELKKFEQTIYNTKLSPNARKNNNKTMGVMKNNLINCDHG
jgi:hypothetical protein